MTAPQRSASQLAVAWRRFRRNISGVFGLFIVVFVLFVAISVPFMALRSPTDNAAFLEGKAVNPPSWEYPFGTDGLGFCVFSRVVYGARTALLVGFGAMAIAGIIGILIGAAAGYLGGKAEELLMRLTDAFMVIPVFLVVLVMVKMFSMALAHAPVRITGFNELLITLIIGLFGWPALARLTRAEFLRIKNLDFVKAARCVGASTESIIFRHILPNALPPVVVVLSLGIATAILYEASISFLGFGDPSVVSWGMMLTFAQRDLPQAWWEALFPGVAIFLTVLGFNLLGDGLNEAFNPRLRS